MGARIFLTGATGYIGGSVLETLVHHHPDYEITVLLRNAPIDFNEEYPNVRVVNGDYDSKQILSDTASQANIVVHCGNSDHEPAIKALIQGLLRRSEKSFLIHLGGTATFSDWKDGEYVGELSPKVWSDVDHIDEIWSVRDDALHRNVDKIIQEAAAQHGSKLKTAIVCPPDIYGKGGGPGRIRSILLPGFYSEIKRAGATFYTGSGQNKRCWVHIDDLMMIYLKLVEAAAGGGAGADWGREGYYFASSEEITQIDLAKAAGKVLKAQGLIESDEPKRLPPDEIDMMFDKFGLPHVGTYMFSSNSRTRPDRARKNFGYQPKAPGLVDTLEEDFLACQV